MYRGRVAISARAGGGSHWGRRAEEGGSFGEDAQEEGCSIAPDVFGLSGETWWKGPVVPGAWGSPKRQARQRAG